MTQGTVDVDALVMMAEGEDLDVTLSSRSSRINRTQDLCVHDGIEEDDENYPPNIKKSGVFHKTLKNASYAVLYREISRTDFFISASRNDRKYILAIYIWPGVELNDVRDVIDNLGLEM